jgi:hypothetical protein
VNGWLASGKCSQINQPRIMTRSSYRAARLSCSPGYAKGSTQRCCSYRHSRPSQPKRKVTGWLAPSVFNGEPISIGYRADQHRDSPTGRRDAV